MRIVKRVANRYFRSIATFSVIGLACFAAEPASDDPNAERASFQVADGFEVNLFASEKDGLLKPIQIRFDTRGRLWVIGSVVYPQLEPGQKPNDKVLILEDTNGDGRCDSVKTFAEGLMIPTGLELTKSGALVGHGPELLELRDTNGDDRADERTVVLRGFGTADNHQNINSFAWGPSGELWMCQGLHNFSRVETPHGLVELNKAGIWRFWPDRLKLEGFYGSEFEPQNPWGHVFNQWNEHLVIAGNNSSPIYPDPGLVPNRRDDPPALLWPTGNGRKCSGGDFVQNAHFPEDWQGRLILGGYINNAVWSVNVRDDGAGFRFEDAPPLIRSTGREFRPVDVKFGPDGALYICDWYNPIIGHYQASFRHPDRDKTHGRIWRVTAKGRALTKRAQIDGAPVAALLELLKSPDRWTVAMARRELASRPRSEILSRLPNDTTSSPGIILGVLGLLNTAGATGRVEQMIAAAAESKTPQLRAFAAQMIGQNGGRELSAKLLPKLAADANPRVRLQAIVACAQLDSAEAIEIAAIAADQPFDPFLNYAFNQAVHSLKTKWLPRLRAGDLDFTGHPERLAALVRADASADTLQALRGYLTTAKPEFLALIAEVGTPDDLAGLLRLPAQKLDAAPALFRIISERNVRPAGDLAAALKPLMQSKHRASVYDWIARWNVEPLLPQVRAIAMKPGGEDRAWAINALGQSSEDLELLRQLASEADGAVRAAAVSALQLRNPQTAAREATILFTGDSSSNQATAVEVLNAFLKRPASAKALAAALQGKQIAPATANACLTSLNSSGRRNEELAAIFRQNAGGAKTVDGAFVTEVRAHGDPGRGAAIFARKELGCTSCHKINGAGGVIGPDLTALGTAQPIDFIARAILEPQKEIKEGFISVSIATKDGDDYQGYIVRETREEVILRDPLPNREVRIPRAQIATLRANGSLMPNGLADSLSVEEFRDLVAYLAGSH